LSTQPTGWAAIFITRNLCNDKQYCNLRYSSVKETTQQSLLQNNLEANVSRQPSALAKVFQNLTQDIFSCTD